MARLSISDSVLSSVLSKYPLSQARVLNVLESSKRNDNFVIENVSGKRYVLRRYRRNNQEARVRFQLYFQQHIESSGFPTSEIIRTISNDVLVIEEDSPWVLFSFIEGKEYDFGRVKQVIEAARRLAQFHTVTKTLKHEEVVLNISRMPDWWIDSEREISMLNEFFTGKGVEKELVCIREYVDELIHECPSDRAAALQLSWVHGDYHGRNMVFVKDEMRGLFDFDVVHYGYRIEDIYRAIFMFGRHNWESSVIRTDVAQAFLEEYMRNTELQQEELETLPIIAALDWVPFASYFVMLQRDGENTVSYLESFVKTMRTMRSEMKRLESIFRGLYT